MSLLTIVARLFRVAALALALVMLLPAVRGFAQSPTLAELAKKEQERRKTVKQAPKVYSNKDLPKKPEPQGTPAELPPATPPAAEPKPAAAPKAGEEKDEAWWRARITQAREGLRRNEMFAEALQSRINSLSADVVNRDDPFQRAKIAEDRQKAVAELERVKAEIADGKKQVADIEEEARQAGVPPGWLR